LRLAHLARDRAHVRHSVVVHQHRRHHRTLIATGPPPHHPHGPAAPPARSSRASPGQHRRQHEMPPGQALDRVSPARPAPAPAACPGQLSHVRSRASRTRRWVGTASRSLRKTAVVDEHCPTRALRVQVVGEDAAISGPAAKGLVLSVSVQPSRRGQSLRRRHGAGSCTAPPSAGKTTAQLAGVRERPAATARQSPAHLMSCFDGIRPGLPSARGDVVGRPEDPAADVDAHMIPTAPKKPMVRGGTSGPCGVRGRAWA